MATIIGDAITVLALKALLNVTTKPGATVTIKKGSVTVATLTANSSGKCSLEILAVNFGTYTISSVSGMANGSASVNVTDVTTYNVTVAMTMYFIKDGNFVSGTGHTSVGDSSRTFADQGDYVLLSTYTGGSLAYVSGYMTPTVTLDGYWKNLVLDSQEVGISAHFGVCASNTAQEASFTASTTLFSGERSSFTSRHTSTCSVSSVSGTMYPALRAKAWIRYGDNYDVIGSAGQIRVYNLYLRST